MAIELIGNWKKGRAFDVHTLSSTYLGPNEQGHAQWDSVRSDMGELIYQLKYKNDRSKLEEIVRLLDKIKGVEQFDFLMPIPPTDKTRAFQPVTEIALALGKRREVNVLTDFLEKKAGGPQLKNIDDPEERKKILRESLRIATNHSIKGKSVLLVDDLFRSGATLEVATALLLNEAHASEVCVLTMTKTRSNR
jgi:predicted amidophosphoribosyltransferase